MLELVCVKDILFSFNHRQSHDNCFFPYPYGVQVLFGFDFVWCWLFSFNVLFFFHYHCSHSKWGDIMPVCGIVWSDISLCSGPRLGFLLPVQPLIWHSEDLGHQGLEDGPQGVLLCFLKYLESCFLIDLVLEDFLSYFLSSHLCIFKIFKHFKILFCFSY